MAVRPQTDDPVAFEELWEHREHVRAVCFGIVKDPVVVDDLVQDTYVRALTTAHPPDRRGPVAAWLAVVARHRAVDTLRADRFRKRSRDPEATAGDIGDPVDQMLRSETRNRVRGALAELGMRDRQLLVQHVVHGMSVAELATRERTSEASMRSTLWRARQKLRAAVERGGPLGVVPTEHLVGPLRRLRALCARLEASGMTLVAGVVMHLVETTATAVVTALLVISSSSPSSDPAIAWTVHPPSTTTIRTPPPTHHSEVKVGARVRVGNLSNGELRPTVPRAAFAVGTEVGQSGVRMTVASESYEQGGDFGVTVELSTPAARVSRGPGVTWSCGNSDFDVCPPAPLMTKVIASVNSQ